MCIPVSHPVEKGQFPKFLVDIACLAGMMILWEAELIIPFGRFTKKLKKTSVPPQSRRIGTPERFLITMKSYCSSGLSIPSPQSVTMIRHWLQVCKTIRCGICYDDSEDSSCWRLERMRSLAAFLIFLSVEKVIDIERAEIQLWRSKTKE